MKSDSLALFNLQHNHPVGHTLDLHIKYAFLVLSALFRHILSRETQFQFVFLNQTAEKHNECMTAAL